MDSPILHIDKTVWIQKENRTGKPLKGHNGIDTNRQQSQKKTEITMEASITRFKMLQKISDTKNGHRQCQKQNNSKFMNTKSEWGDSPYKNDLKGKTSIAFA